MTSWWGCRLHSQHGWLPIWPAYGAWPDARVRACDPEQAASRSRAWCHPRRPSLSRWQWRRTRHADAHAALPPLQTEAAPVGCAAGCVDGFCFNLLTRGAPLFAHLLRRKTSCCPRPSACRWAACSRESPTAAARRRSGQSLAIVPGCFAWRKSAVHPQTRHGKESPLPLSRFSSPPRAAENRRATSCSAPPRRRCPCPLAARIAATASPPRR